MSDNSKIDDLLDRTAQFLLDGHPFSMADLARDLGVARKTLYNHFHNRKILLKMTIDHFFERVARELEEKTEGDEPFIDRGERVLEHLIDCIEKIERLRSREILKESQVEYQYKKIYQSIKRKTGDFVSEGQATGWIRPDLSPDQVVELYLALILGSLHNPSGTHSMGTFFKMVILGLASDNAGDNVKELNELDPSRKDRSHPLWTKS